jgi:hypothetical protein
MIRRSATFLLIGLSLCGVSSRAATLPVPDNLIDLTSKSGEQLLVESHDLDGYVRLSANFLTQKNQAFCGVASIVIVLNALDVSAPPAAEYEPYHTFTQDNLLDDRAEAILPREVVTRQGMTLDQLGRLLALHPVQAEVHHAGEGTLEAFRSAARDYLGDPGRAVIVNYLRKTIGEERGGHISPLAAYDSEADRFLILDVARYKYPPVWVKTADLFAAMNTPDQVNNNQTRGYVLIRRSE